MIGTKFFKTAKLANKTPLKILLKMVFIVFFSEMLLMVLFHLISVPTDVTIILDPILLTIILTPVLYVFVYQPLESEISRRKQIESELLKSRDSLEKKVIERTSKLAEANTELQKAFDEVKTLTGLIPICASCKKVRDDLGYWKQIESYITDHSGAEFTHSVCQECTKKLYPDLADEHGNV